MRWMNLEPVIQSEVSQKKSALINAYILYLHDYISELENFSDTFLKYLPFYVRNSDYFETLDELEDLDTQLISRSKSMRKNSRVIPQRKIESDGIYGELFRKHTFWGEPRVWFKLLLGF